MFTKSPHRDPVSDTARAFSAGSRITAVGTFISAAEEFSRSREMSDTGLFSWPIRRTAFRTLSHPKLDKPLRTLGHPRYRWLVGARALASLGVIVAPRVVVRSLRPFAREELPILLRLRLSALVEK